MGYAYLWLPESERKKIGCMCFFYSANKIVSIFGALPNDLIIEYKNQGSQTSVIHEKRDMMFDANFVDVFCEDLKLLIQNHRWWLDVLMVLYKNDCWEEGLFDEIRDELYNEEILDPIIKKIFDTLETSLKSRRHLFPARWVKVAPAILDQGLSLVNLFKQKELKSFEIHFEKRQNRVDLESLVLIQTCNQQYCNDIEVYLDVITQDHWLLLQKLKSMEIIYSLVVLYENCHPENLSEMFPDTNENEKIQLSKVEWEFGGRFFTPRYYPLKNQEPVNDQSVPSMSSEVASQVFENPIIMKRIMEHLCLYDIIRLRKVSYGIRNCVDDEKTDPHIKSYSLMFRMFLPKKQKEEQRWQQVSNMTSMTIELMHDDDRRTTNYWSGLILGPWPTNNDFDVNALFGEGLDDFEANARHQKTYLEELEIVYCQLDKYHETVVNLRSEKLAERIAELLARRSEPLKVRKLSIGAKYPWEVTSILSHIDKDSLKTIQFLKAARKDENPLDSNPVMIFDMGDISNVEQWMHAENFISSIDVILTTPIQQANITHFAKVDIVVDTLSSDDVLFLKTVLHKSVSFQKFKIVFKKSTIDETLHALIGEPYRNVPNVKKIWYFRGQTNPDYYLHIVLDTHTLEDRIRSLILSRVKKEDTPFFQNQ